MWLAILLHRKYLKSIMVSVAFLYVGQVWAVNADARVEYSALYDSNFSRSEIKQDETIGIASLRVDFSTSYSKQELSSALQFRQMAYEKNENLDSSYVTGDFDWEGQLGAKILFDITAKRDAYAVDPLEYKDKDIVSKNDYLVSIGYGSRDALSVWLGGVNSKQTHTAQERELLDFDQPELFLEVVAVGEDGLQHHLSVSKGERIYKTGLSSTGELIDYDYSELAYDLDWKNNNTHQVSLGIAAFKRVGELNSDQGFLWNSQWLWNIKPKFSVLLGYSENQPAAGEEVETPTAINDVTAVLRWKISDRIQLESDYLYSKQKYITQSTGFERDEQWQRWRPLIIVYSGSRYLSARLAGELYSRETGSDFREYKGAGISLMLSLSFW